jgi:hypothetical protein
MGSGGRGAGGGRSGGAAGRGGAGRSTGRASSSRAARPAKTGGKKGRGSNFNEHGTHGNNWNAHKEGKRNLSSAGATDPTPAHSGGQGDENANNAVGDNFGDNTNNTGFTHVSYDANGNIIGG